MHVLVCNRAAALLLQLLYSPRLCWCRRSCRRPRGVVARQAPASRLKAKKKTQGGKVRLAHTAVPSRPSNQSTINHQSSQIPTTMIRPTLLANPVTLVACMIFNDAGQINLATYHAIPIPILMKHATPHTQPTTPQPLVRFPLRPTISPPSKPGPSSFTSHLYLFYVLEEGEREYPAGPAPVEAQDADPLLPLHLRPPLVGAESGQALVGHVLGVGEPSPCPAQNTLRAPWTAGESGWKGWGAGGANALVSAGGF